jgi:hypothetical protein
MDLGKKEKDRQRLVLGQTDGFWNERKTEDFGRERQIDGLSKDR